MSDTFPSGWGPEEYIEFAADAKRDGVSVGFGDIQVFSAAPFIAIAKHVGEEPEADGLATVRDRVHCRYHFRIPTGRCTILATDAERDEILAAFAPTAEDLRDAAGDAALERKRDLEITE